MADGSKTCSVEGCERVVLARGWCNSHYYQWNRAQKPREEVRRKWREDYYKRRESISAKRQATNPPQRQRDCIDCGTTIYRVHVRGAIPTRCPECRREYDRKRSRARGERRRSRVTHTTCWTCGREFALPATRERGKIAGYCPPCRLLKNRQRRAERRARERAGDVTDAVLLALSRKRHCATCGVVMTRAGGPRQRQIDHIVPLHVGGEHTPANLRAICRTCNYKRPKDGSDLAQMPLAFPT